MKRAASDTETTLVIALDRAPRPVPELTADCEHGKQAFRGDFLVGRAAKAVRWRVLFCDPCWEHFRTHQEVIDLSLFEGAPGPAQLPNLPSAKSAHTSETDGDR